MKANASSVLAQSPRRLSGESLQFVGRIRASEMLAISPQTLDKLIRTGALKAFRIGRRVIVRRDELLKFVEANEL